MNTLARLTSLLDDFYSSNADVNTVGRWLILHTFEEALADHAEAASIDIWYETQSHLARTRMVAGYTKDVSNRRRIAKGDLSIEFSLGGSLGKQYHLEYI